ncbi:hypothetical protein ANO11243_018790 [Dothideomycetidae sp. 11243]|nr:hypothetical protein ANO11243_018790 [fungal sp. No.11243]
MVPNQPHDPSIGLDDGPNAFIAAAALVCFIWYCIVISVSMLGYTQLVRPQSKSSLSPDAPRVTVIRPIKGLEPNLYECLAATFRQDYPSNRLDIFFCVSDSSDPSIPILERLVEDFPNFDVQILVETEDAVLQAASLGPNPKIRNMSRAYREAKGDNVWIIDCNVWVAHGTLGRMVDTLQDTPAKFVHLLPLVVDVTDTQSTPEATQLLSDTNGSVFPSSTSTRSFDTRSARRELKLLDYGGGRLEEMFMSSSHAKFYTAINTVLIAPCIVGKSTMFRKSHLDGLTDGRGIDYFSENICEDHLIGDILWKRKVPQELAGESWANHAMVFGDLAVQPMAGMSVGEYISRRVRWLRVRKFTVILATLVEPGTESFLCSVYGAFAAACYGIIPQTVLAFALFWLLNVMLWCAIDWSLYLKLQSCASIAVDEHTPVFCRPPRSGRRRAFSQWLFAWLGREALAFPVWAWAVYGGTTVTWRGKIFRVGLDMKVHEITGARHKRCE